MELEARTDTDNHLSPGQTAEAASQRERVVRDIIQGIYDGRYQPGQRLVEADLTSTHALSRGTVREALNRLAASGVVELTQQRGAHVRVLTVDEAIDILTVTEALDIVAARLAAVRIDRPGAKEMLQAALQTLLSFDPYSGTAEHARARDQFYATLTDIGGNAELRRILPSVRGHLIRAQFRKALRSADRRRHTDYRRIAEAVLAGRPAAAEAAMKMHVRRAIAAPAAFRDANAPQQE